MKKSKNTDKILNKALNNPVYKKLPKKKTSTVIDERFAAVLNDPQFMQDTYTDKRGRKFNNIVQEDYSSKYHLEDDIAKIETGKSTTAIDSEDGDSKHNADTAASGHLDKVRPVYDIRGEYLASSSETSDDSDTNLSDFGSDDFENLDNTENINIFNQFEQANGPKYKFRDSATHRLAVINLDWDRLDANDIYMLFHSALLSKDSAVENGQNPVVCAKIYVSEYGHEMLEKERTEGPQLPEIKSEELLGEDQAALLNRKYQLQRMRYYFAIVEFKNTDFANQAYEMCDGMEWEHSALAIELSFVPEDTEFEDDRVKYSCSTLPTSYQPIEFQASQLQHTNLKFDWDENDPKRLLLTNLNRKMTIDEIEQNEQALNDLIASPSEDEEDHQVSIKTYKDLLLAGDLNDSANEDESDMDDFGHFDSDTGFEEDKEITANEQDEIDLAQFKMTNQVKNKLSSDPFFSLKNTKPQPHLKSDITNNQFKQMKKNTKVTTNSNHHLNSLHSINSDEIESTIQVAKYSDQGSLPKNTVKSSAKKTIFNDSKDDFVENKTGGMHELIKKNKMTKSKARKLIIEKKRHKHQELLNTDDKRFKAVFEAGEYAIDPSSTHYKKSDFMENVLNRQCSQRVFTNPQDETYSKAVKSTETNSTNDTFSVSHLNSLVDSVKHIKPTKRMKQHAKKM